MAKSVLDLYELYNLVIARGGLVDVINKKLWQEIIKGLHLPSSITSAAFTLRTQYMKYLYPYECEKKNLSSPAELQAAIDGNRREGRRSSYGQFEAMHSQMQMPQMSRSNLPGAMQQISPLALVTHGNQQAAAAAAAHHRLMGPNFGQVPNLVQHEIEQRMMEYLKLIQAKKELPRPRSQSPETTTREALNALEMSRVALWSMYHNNTSPPASVNTSPQGIEPQREALNLSDSPPNVVIKREREREPSELGANSDREDFNQPPPAKRGFQTTIYVPPIRGNFPTELDGVRAGHSPANISQEDMKTKPTNERDGRQSPQVIYSLPPLKTQQSGSVPNDIPKFSPNRLQEEQPKATTPQAKTDKELSLLSGMQFKLSNKSNISQEQLAQQDMKNKTANTRDDRQSPQLQFSPPPQKAQTIIIPNQVPIFSPNRLQEEKPKTTPQIITNKVLLPNSSGMQFKFSNKPNTSQEQLAQQDMKNMFKNMTNGRQSPELIISVPKEVFEFASNEQLTEQQQKVIRQIINNNNLSVPMGMKFKLLKCIGANGEQQLVVSLQLNGMNYEGVLMANPISTSSTADKMITSPPPSPVSIVSNGPNDTQKKTGLEERPITLIRPN